MSPRGPKIPEKDNIYGFGSAAKRFKYLGIHPELIKWNTTNPLGPGEYNPKRPDCAYKKKATNWTECLKSEEFSKFLGYHNPQLLCNREFQKTLGGPGNYDLIDYKNAKGPSVLENVGFGTEERFHSAIKDETLPPGTHTIKTPKTKFNTTPLFEWGGFASRFKSTEPAYKLPPNRYDFPDQSIVKKRVSKRGPYDTFTGPRDQTTIKNHFAPPLFKSPDTIYDIPSALDHLLHHSSKKRCGRFLMAERFPEGVTPIVTSNGLGMYLPDEEFPGPATYSVFEGIQEVKKNLHPFNSSNVHARQPPNWRIHPGPDRYKVKYPTCHKKGHQRSWMFASKAPRCFFKVESYSNFYY